MLFKKFLRDLWHNKIQFISIFLMAALSTFIFAGMGSLYSGLFYAQSDYYSKTNFANYWVYSNDGFIENDIDTLESMKNVEGINRRQVIYNCVAPNQNNASITVYVVDKEKYDISTCLVMEGKEWDGSIDGVWLDYRFAKENNISVDEDILLTIDGLDYIKKVVGLVINPEYIYQADAESIVPNHKDNGFAYLSNIAITGMDMNKFNEIVIKTKNNSELDKKDIENCLSNYSMFRERKDLPSHSMFSEAIAQYRVIGIVFPIAFLAVTILTMLTTMTRLVDKQRVQIGTLGTLGIKKRKIYRHYLSFGFFPSMLGCILGLVVAPFTLPYTYYETLKKLYTMEYWKPRLPLSSIIIVIICVSLCVMVTYITIRKVLKETPAQAVKPKVSKDLEQYSRKYEKLHENMKFSVKWNIIDIVKGKLRTIMTIVGIAGCMGLLIGGFGFRDSLDHCVKYQYSDIYRFNSKLTIDTSKEELMNNDKIIDDIEKKYDKVDSVYEGQVEVKGNDKRKITNIVVEDNIQNIKYYNKKGEITLDKAKVNLSRKVANILKVEKGDRIVIKPLNSKEYKEVEVGSIYLSPVTQGITISKELYTDLGYNYYSNYAYSVDRIDNNSGIEGVTKVVSKDKLRKDYEETKKTLDSISVVLMASAVLLAIVVLYNLNMLTLYEKQSEFAVLKVLGFKSSRIRNLLLGQTVVLTAIGIVFGIPFGRGLVRVILSSMGDSVDMDIYITLFTYCVSVALTFGISVLMNILFIFKIRKIDMVSSLKTID